MVTVERLALSGRGVPHRDSFVLFVDDALPGDRVRAALAGVSAASSGHELPESSPYRVSALRTTAPGAGCPQDLACGSNSRPGRPVRQTSPTLALLRHRAPAVSLPLPQQDGVLVPSGFDASLSTCIGAAMTKCSRRVVLAGERAGEPDRPSHAALRRRARLAYHAVQHTGTRFLVVRHLAQTGQALVNLVCAKDQVTRSSAGPEIRPSIPRSVASCSTWSFAPTRLRRAGLSACSRAPPPSRSAARTRVRSQRQRLSADGPAGGRAYACARGGRHEPGGRSTSAAPARSPARRAQRRRRWASRWSGSPLRRAQRHSKRNRERALPSRRGARPLREWNES